MKSSTPEVSLVLACYNEAGLFRDSLVRITDMFAASAFTYEIIFVDDASADATPRLIESFVRRHAGVSRAIYHTDNRGRGYSVREGIRAARGNVVGYIDIDCEVSPVYIPEMVAHILAKRADVVIGKRYYRSSPRAIIREVLSRGYQWLADSMIGTGKLDTETGYKFFDRKKILPPLAKTRQNGWFWDTEIMVYARRANLTILEVPVLFLRRFDKQSSVNILKDTVDYLVQLWKFRRRLHS